VLFTLLAVFTLSGVANGQRKGPNRRAARHLAAVFVAAAFRPAFVSFRHSDAVIPNPAALLADGGEGSAFGVLNPVGAGFQPARASSAARCKCSAVLQRGILLSPS
jgi:hypothetical protein